MNHLETMTTVPGLYFSLTVFILSAVFATLSSSVREWTLLPFLTTTTAVFTANGCKIVQLFEPQIVCGNNEPVALFMLMVFGFAVGLAITIVLYDLRWSHLVAYSCVAVAVFFYGATALMMEGGYTNPVALYWLKVWVILTLIPGLIAGLWRCRN